MTKDKLQSLEKYVQMNKFRLEAEVPKKHQDHPDTYKAFLRNEIRTTEAKIAAAKLEGVK